VIRLPTVFPSKSLGKRLMAVESSKLKMSV
jgi:hypothetical protein